MSREMLRSYTKLEWQSQNSLPVICLEVTSDGKSAWCPTVQTLNHSEFLQDTNLYPLPGWEMIYTYIFMMD